MRLIVFTSVIIIPVVLQGCFNNDKGKTKNSETIRNVKKDTEIKKIVIRQIKKDSIILPAINIAIFELKTDSLLTSILKKPIKFDCLVDTIPTNSKNECSGLIAMTKPAYSMVKRYWLYPGKGKRYYRPWIVSALYKNREEATNVFDTLRKIAEFAPGLTYGYDYLFETDTKIYWLSGGCSFSLYNFKLLIGFEKVAIRPEKITDSILCECGGGNMYAKKHGYR